MTPFERKIYKLYEKHIPQYRSIILKESVQSLAQHLSSCEQIEITDIDQTSGRFTILCNGKLIKAQILPPVMSEDEEELSVSDEIERIANKKKDPRAQAAVSKRKNIENQMIDKFEKDTQKLQQLLRK